MFYDGEFKYNGFTRSCKLPNPVLRRKAHKVTDFGGDFQTLIDEMIETMRNEPGVGLAAPQVKVSLRVIVVEYPEDDSSEDAPPSFLWSQILNSRKCLKNW